MNVRKRLLTRFGDDGFPEACLIVAGIMLLMKAISSLQ